jgi:hypothetical protein
MSEPVGELEGALDRMVAAAQAHLAAVTAAAGAPDDEAVWQAFVALNNAAHTYDELLSEVFGEVTPWDLEPIVEGTGAEARSTLVSMPASPGGEDPHPRVVSVRQRRDYRVPSVAALLRVAEASRPSPDEGGSDEPVRSVGEAVIELLQSGDGSLGMLDLPELEPLDGVIVVAEVDSPLPANVLDEVDDSESDQPFRLGHEDTVVARVHESTDVVPSGPDD